MIKPRNSKEVSRGEKFGSSGGWYVAYIKRTIIKCMKLANTGYSIPLKLDTNPSVLYFVAIHGLKLEIGNWEEQYKSMKAKFDEFVKSRKIPFSVIPAKAGIQENTLDAGSSPA